MQSSKEQNTKSKRTNKRRNSRKKSLSPTNFKTLHQDYKSEKKFECKRSLSESSVKPKHRKSNIRRTLSHPFTDKIPVKSDDTEVPVECVNSEVVKSVSEERDSRSDPGAPDIVADVARLPSVADAAAKRDSVSDDSNLPVETSSDRDTEDERKWPRAGRRAEQQLRAVRGSERGCADPLLRFGRQQFAVDSGSDLESLAASTVRRVSVRRRRGTPETGSSSAKEEFVELESGRMRPEDYRLVFLSSDSSCKEDNEDSSSTASSVAPLFTEDCDWDYFEPGGAGAARPAPPAAAALPPPPPCPRACSCGAEPRIVAVPVPVPVPVPAALWPSLLVYPETPDAQPWSLFNFPKNFPAFRNFDAAELARLASRHVADAGAAMAAREQRPDLEPSESGTSPADTPDCARRAREDDGAHRPSDPDDIKVITEEPSPRPDIIGHLEAERALSSSGDSAESTDGERERADGGEYELTGSVPSEPATSDAESEASSAPGEGRFSRVFVVNPADSSSDVEDNADSSGIDCSEVDDKSGERYGDITIEEALLNDKNSSPPGADACAAPPSPPPPPPAAIAPGEDAPRANEKSALKCSDFIKFCDLNMLQSDDEIRAIDRNAAETESSVGKTHLFCEENAAEKEKLVENVDAHEKVKVFEADDRSDDCGRESETQESEINLSSGVTASPVSRPASPSAGGEPIRQIDLLKGIERTLSELLKNESSFERRRDEEKLFSEPPGAAGGGEGARSPRCDARAPAAASAAAVSRPRPARADGPARYTSRVMITHDHVSVVTSDATSVMRDVTVHHTNLQNEERADDGEAEGDREPEGSVTVVTNADTLSAVVCLEEGLADDDSWVEDVSHDEDAATSPTESDSGDEATLSPGRGEDFTGFCRRSLDFTLHTIPEESCEESEPEHARRSRPISATELEKYFFFGIGDGRHVSRDEDEPEETSSVCSEGGESIAGNEGSERGDDEAADPERLASSRLEKYFLSGFMGFNQERRESDGSGSVGSDSEGRHSPEQRRKRLVRARGTPRSHSSSLDNLIAGDEAPAEAPDDSEGSSTETEACLDSTERLDGEKRKKSKKTRSSPADERRHSAEFGDDAREDARSISEGEEGGRTTPRQEFPPLGSELSESKKQTSRDSGFVGSCDDLLRGGDSSAELRGSDQRSELEEITEELRPEADERAEAAERPPSPLARKDSFNNWSSDEETNLMMTKMRQFFKTMVGSAPARASTPAADTSGSTTPNSSGSRRLPKPPQLLYFESELTRLMKTVPGIRDEEVREIVEYLSSEDTWSDSYDSSDYAGSDLEGPGAGRSALRRQISESCREIIDEFDRGVEREAGGVGDRELERDAACAYRKLVASLGRVAGEGASPRGSPPLVAKVMRHIGGRLVALMHEVSSGESAVASPRPRPPRRARPASATTTEDDDSASDASAALPRSRSHDVLEAARARGEERDASDCDRFSWRGSFESALLAADSRGTLSGEAGAAGARRSAGDLLAAQRTQSRSCGAIGGSEDRLWRGRRRSSAPDAAEEEAEARAGSLPRLPSGAAAATPVKSARYRAPGFSRAVRAVSAPGLPGLASRPRRRAAPHAPPTPAATSAASSPATPSTPLLLHEDAFGAELLPQTSATLPRRSNSPLPAHDADDLYRLGVPNRSGLQARSESMASVYSGAGEGARGAVSVRGAAQFSLVYNYKLGALEVGVRRCRDLAPVDVKRNRSDPYVKVYLLPDKSKCGKRKTKVKKNTLNPIFEECLRFAQPLDALATRTLWLSVWSADMFGRNDFLGEVTLPLADMLFDEPAPKWYQLQERTEQFDEQQGSKGDVIVGLKFELPEAAGAGAGATARKGTLHVLVKEAKNLVATKPSGMADAFCKSYLLPERGRLSKQKSAVVRRSLNPRWEHAFTYRGITLHELTQRALELSVWDRDRITSNDFMGGVRFSLGTGSYMGSSVNWMDSVGREVTLWQTMMQRPNFWVEGSVPLRSHLSN